VAGLRATSGTSFRQPSSPHFGDCRGLPLANPLLGSGEPGSAEPGGRRIAFGDSAIAALGRRQGTRGQAAPEIGLSIVLDHTVAIIIEIGQGKLDPFVDLARQKPTVSCINPYSSQISLMTISHTQI
jgi:hypothetical protein